MPSGEFAVLQKYALVQVHNGSRTKPTRTGGGEPAHSQPAANTTVSPWWLSAGAVAAAGAAGIVVSACLFVIYALSASYLPIGSAGRVCMVAVAMCALIVSLLTLVAAWAVRIGGRRDRLAREALQTRLEDIESALAKNRAVMEQLPEDMRLRAESLGRTYLHALNDHSTAVRAGVGELVGMVRELRQIVAAVAHRQAELEQRVKRQGAQIEDLRTIASVFAEPPENGQVHQLRPR